MMMGFGMIFWVLIIGVIIYFLINNQNNARTVYHNAKITPLQILDEKYAKGEISEEEYLRKRKILKD